MFQLDSGLNVFKSSEKASDLLLPSEKEINFSNYIRLYNIYTDIIMLLVRQHTRKA